MVNRKTYKFFLDAPEKRGFVNNNQYKLRLPKYYSDYIRRINKDYDAKCKYDNVKKWYIDKSDMIRKFDAEKLVIDRFCKKWMRVHCCSYRSAVSEYFRQMAASCRWSDEYAKELYKHLHNNGII